jgi:hypothetical protein
LIVQLVDNGFVLTSEQEGIMNNQGDGREIKLRNLSKWDAGKMIEQRPSKIDALLIQSRYVQFENSGKLFSN